MPLRLVVRNDQVYFYFPDLVIHQPGLYRIRVSLMQMVNSSEGLPEQTVVYDEVDSQSITVEVGEVSNSSLIYQRAYLSRCWQFQVQLSVYS